MTYNKLTIRTEHDTIKIKVDHMGHWLNQTSKKLPSTSSGVFYCIQKPRHCGGVKKSLSGEQRKKAPNVLIY